MTCGLKTDQLLHTTIATEYNKNLDFYSGNAHPDVVGGRNTDASIYDDISWQKSKKVFTELTHEYDKVFYNWKKSGFHGDIPVEDEETGELTVPGSQKKPSLILCMATVRSYTCTDLYFNSWNASK